MSYHNGSVWPHDVAIIAMGFSKYGLKEEVLQLTNGLFDASLFIELQRLPELFCGLERRPGEGPTDYPVACSPQAWSVGSVYMLLQACLGIEIVAKERVLKFNNPVMPKGVKKIHIEPLVLGEKHVAIDVQNKKGHIQIKIPDLPKDWQMQIFK